MISLSGPLASSDRVGRTLMLPWPTDRNPIGFLTFTTQTEWESFIERLSLPSWVPVLIVANYRRAQKLYGLSWVDADLLKSGELEAFTALENALKDRYGSFLPKRQRTLAPLLKYMVDVDGLTDEKIPVAKRSGGSVVANIRERPELAEMRNRLAHGTSFDTGPTAGLLEIVRDLIAYAYRSFGAQ